MAVDLASSSGGRPTPNVNVTPLVDVALVVLIIFMVVTPLAIRELRILLPVPSDKAAAAAEPTIPLTLHIENGGTMELNGKPLANAELEAGVGQGIARAKGVLHVDADDGVPYGDVIDAVDRARRAGAQSIAIVTHPTD